MQKSQSFTANISYIQITIAIYYISKHFMPEIFAKKYKDIEDSTSFDLSGILQRRSHSRNCLILGASGQFPKKKATAYMYVYCTRS